MRGIDWPRLRGTVVFIVLALAADAAAVALSVRFHDEAAREHERQQSRLAAAVSQYRSIDSQRRLVERRLPEFLALEEAGVIGGERRLAWIETLREVAARANLPSLRYRIERRSPYRDNPELDSGTYRPFSTVVHIETSLLHEGDLVGLIRELEALDTGLHRIDRCEVRRAAPEIVMRPGAVNLTAECQLRWFTLAPMESPA